MAGLKQSEINRRLVWLLNICSHVHPFMDELVNIHSSKHIRQIQGEQHWLAAFCFFCEGDSMVEFQSSNAARS